MLMLSMRRVWAAEVMPVVENQRVGVEIRHLSFPDTLDRDLKSGLSSRLLARITLQAESRPLAR